MKTGIVTLIAALLFSVGSATQAAEATVDAAWARLPAGTNWDGSTTWITPDGKGNAAAGYPALSGQDTPYVELQLKAFRSGERANDEAEVMRMMAARLTDTEIAAVASYVAGLR
jgi:cytochrome c553